MGEERYWGEIYPAVMERELTVEAFIASKGKPPSNAVDYGRWRTEIAREAVAAADIELPGDIDAALRYLEALAELGERAS